MKELAQDPADRGDGDLGALAAEGDARGGVDVHGGQAVRLDQSRAQCLVVQIDMPQHDAQGGAHVGFLAGDQPHRAEVGHAARGRQSKPEILAPGVGGGQFEQPGHRVDAQPSIAGTERGRIDPTERIDGPGSRPSASMRST